MTPSRLLYITDYREALQILIRFTLLLRRLSAPLQHPPFEVPPSKKRSAGRKHNLKRGFDKFFLKRSLIASIPNSPGYSSKPHSIETFTMGYKGVTLGIKLPMIVWE